MCHTPNACDLVGSTIMVTLNEISENKLRVFLATDVLAYICPAFCRALLYACTYHASVSFCMDAGSYADIVHDQGNT